MRGGAGTRRAAWLAAAAVVSCVTSAGCEAVLGTGSLGDRPAGDGGNQDGTVGAEGGSESGSDTGLRETGTESGTDATVNDGGADAASESSAVDAAPKDSGGAESGTVDSGGGDSGTADSGAVESGAVDSGAADAGDAGAEAGPPTLSCAIDVAHKRQLNAAGATITADGLAVINSGQSDVLALVATSSPPALAFGFRSDRPGDAPQLVTLQGPTSSPASLLAVTRSVAGNATYVLAADQQSNLLLWTWPDGINPGGPPASLSESPVPGNAQMAATSQGMFYGLADNAGAYADFQVPPTLPTIIAGNQITTLSNGYNDGNRAYRLSDDSVSFLYFAAADKTVHQNHYAPNSTTLSATRQYYAGGMIPYGFHPNGTNVDVTAVIGFGDAGSPVLATATVPESQLFTFNPATALKPIQLSSPANPATCVAFIPGKLVVVNPTTSGMDFFVVDAATGVVTYSLTGSKNLLNGDSAIVNCAISPAVSAAGTLVFELVWTENAGSGPQNLEFAPLQCTLQ